MKILHRSLLLTAVLVTGCTEKKTGAAPAAAQATVEVKVDAPTAEEITTDVRAEATDIFSSRCMPCHGPKGAGDGPASSGFTPPPANFTNAQWQKGVTDEHIEKIIQYGGAAVGKSPAMPPNPDLADKPVVKGLREHIRKLSSSQQATN